MKNTKILFPLFLLLALALVACGGDGGDTAAGPQTIDVTLHDIYFGETNDNVENPPVWTVSSGTGVTVRLDNQGALEHNWTVLKAGEEIPANFTEEEHGDTILFTSSNVAAATTEEVTFTAPAPGEYNVVCTVPGHSALMRGRLVVEG